MLTLIKKYWDLFGGIAMSVLLALLSRFELTSVQLCYSLLILLLVSIGTMRIIRQEVDKQGKKRKHNFVDSIVDGQKSIMAVSLAQAPTKEGEKIGKKIIILWRGIKRVMEKLKTLFDKFKGYLLTTALAVLTIVEMCGGYIDTLLGGALIVNGVKLVPLITLGATVVVGVLSNGYTKEQREKIKALFSRSTTNELVIAEIKKTIKEKSAQLVQFNKVLATQENELDNFSGELETLKNTLDAKKEMCAMVPQLATIEDVQLATKAVVDCQAKIETKKDEIAKTKTTIDNLTTAINALKSQL